MRISCLILTLIISMNAAASVVCFAQCLDDQKVLLLNISSRLAFDARNSSKLAHWDHRVDCCSWPGVVCCSKGRVIELNLRYEWISDGFDDSLAKLQFLSVLRLDGNNLSSTDPLIFAEFPHLVSLSLYSCELQGTFPAEVFQLQTLQNLNLAVNTNLKGSLPRFLGNNSLKTLALASTNFSGTIPESVRELKMLSYLDLSSCNFHGTIPPQLWALKNLLNIDLSYNRLNGSVQSLSSLANLTTLFLYDNQLTGSISEANWKELVRLETLDLRKNSFDGHIPAVLFGMPSLRRLRLSYNKFESLEHVENHNAMLSLLTFIELDNNRLHVPPPAYFFELQGIEWLSMSSNNFSQALDLSLFLNFRNLTYLVLSFNNLSMEAAKIDHFLLPQLDYLQLASCNLKAFPDFLKYQSRLGWLDLSDNQIHGDIPKWIHDVGRFTRLAVSRLNLSCNSLVGFEDRNVPSRLYELDLHSNLLQGELPSLSPLSYYIDFSNNSFSSQLPSDVGENLSSAYYFSLAGNSFKGPIPTSICKAQNLQVLDLSDNLFDGQLPSCIMNLSRTVGVLNLRKNNITGYISDSFTANCALKTLDLSGNHIHGKLPKSLVNCRKLEVLDLGSNEIDDSFPCWLKSISSLRVLVLRSNLLHGSITCPNHTQAWTMLQIVDLACNKFRNSITPEILSSWRGMMVNNNEAESRPDHLKYEVTSLNNLYYQDTVTVTFKGQELVLVKILTTFSSMDLSRNEFSGEIPSMIGNLTSLHVLNLSHNMFTSHIPASLGTLKNLESLDLSHNRLTGRIPAEVATLTFLSVLNLSYNSLEGKVPTGTQLSTFTNDSYLGNKGLCGTPLIECATPPPSEKSSSFSSAIDWQVIIPLFGFICGAGLVLAPLLFWKRWIMWHDEQVRKLVTLIRSS